MEDSVRLCGKSTGGRSCDSVTFSTNGVQYRQVCGRVRGYQFASPDAFALYSCSVLCNNIDSPYVDGVSITHGASPRKHIWTYAAGHDGNLAYSSTCPCTGYGASPPAFVGSDYYCESAVNTSCASAPERFTSLTDPWKDRWRTARRSLDCTMSYAISSDQTFHVLGK